MTNVVAAANVPGMETIYLDDAYELAYGDDVPSLKFVAKEYTGTSRWTTDYMVVFSDPDGDLYGYFFSEPATEEQEGLDPYDQFDDYNEDDGVIHVRPVEQVEKVTYQFTSQ